MITLAFPLSSLTVIVGMFFAAAWALGRCLRSIPTHSRHDGEQGAEDIWDVLDPPDMTIRQNLLCRAIIHRRFADAFDPESTFVSNCPRVHRRFCVQSKELMETASAGDWSDWHAIAAEAVRCYLPKETVAFHEFVRGVTFHAVIVGMMGVNPGNLHFQDVVFVTNAIHILWSLSGTEDPSLPHAAQARLLSEANMHLQRWITNDKWLPNPLRHIVPAYDGLWRLVAQAFRHVHRDATLTRILRDLHDNPCSRQFSAWKACDQPQPSAKHIITETLRLHPPFKELKRGGYVGPCVARSLPCNTGRLLNGLPGPPPVVARIARVQRSPAVWGTEAGAFDATRHHRARCTPQQKECMFSFGYGALKCVAREWAPMAAALILASMLDLVDGKAYSAVNKMEGKGLDDDDDWGGWSIHNIRGGSDGNRYQVDQNGPCDSHVEY